MKNRKVSVIIPVYNVKSFLEKCIDSICNQTYVNLEIIIVDDGSTDGSGELCDKLSEKDQRIKVLHKENGGLSSARNAGLDVFTGEWVAFIDSDDYVGENYIKNMIESCMLFDSDIGACGRYSVFPDRIEIGTKQSTRRKYEADDALYEILTYGCIDVSAWGKIYKSYIFDGIRFPIGMLSEDVAIIYDVLKKANSVAYTGTNDYYYVKREGSITNIGFYTKQRTALENYKKLYLQTKDNSARLQKAGEVFYIRFVMSMLNGYWYKKIYSDCTVEEECFYREVYTNFKNIYGKLVFNKHLSIKEKCIAFMYLTKTYKTIKKSLLNIGLMKRIG